MIGVLMSAAAACTIASFYVDHPEVPGLIATVSLAVVSVIILTGGIK